MKLYVYASKKRENFYTPLYEIAKEKQITSNHDILKVKILFDFHFLSVMNSH